MIDNIKKRSVYDLFNGFKRCFYYCVSVYKVNLEYNKSSFSEALTFSEMSLIDLDEIYADNKRELSYQKYQIIYKRIVSSSTDKPYIVRYENNIVGYYHIAFDINFDSVAKEIVSANDENIHLFDDYTFKKYRGMGIHSFSVYSRMLIGYKKQKKYATVNILDGNIFSEKSYIKLGFVKQRQIHVLFKNFKYVTNK